MSEAMEAVTAIFLEAGWTPGVRDGWDKQFVWKDTNVVGGIDPWGTPRTTGIVDNPNEGPTTREEAARWLVEHAKAQRLEPVLVAEEMLMPPTASAVMVDMIREEAQSQQHETHGEAGEAADAGDADLAGDEPHFSDGTEGQAAEHGDALDEGGSQSETPENETDPDAIGHAFTDADFEPFEQEALAAEEAAEPVALELGEEILETEEPGFGGGAFIFGDNIHQMRTAAIGLVVQISLAKQDAIWLEANTTPEEFGDLQNAVLHDTVDNIYRGRQDVYDRFVALSGFSRRANAVQGAEREKVAFIQAAERAEVEAFDPETGWPE